MSRRKASLSRIQVAVRSWLRAVRAPARTRPRSLIGRTSALCSNSVRSCSSACWRSAGWYAEPRRLQATRSALGATAAVGSICSRVNCCTTGSSFRGRGASSSCARTAMRRACALVSRCTDREVRVKDVDVERRSASAVFRACVLAHAHAAGRQAGPAALSRRSCERWSRANAPSRCRETTKDRTRKTIAVITTFGNQPTTRNSVASTIPQKPSSGSPSAGPKLSTFQASQKTSGPRRSTAASAASATAIPPATSAPIPRMRRMTPRTGPTSRAYDPPRVGPGRTCFLELAKLVFSCA